MPALLLLGTLPALPATLPLLDFLVGDGRAAVDRLRAQNYDLLITDLKMPVMDGLEATRQIKHHLPGIRVVALSMRTVPSAWTMPWASS